MPLLKKPEDPDLGRVAPLSCLWELPLWWGGKNIHCQGDNVQCLWMQRDGQRMIKWVHSLFKQHYWSHTDIVTKRPTEWLPSSQTFLELQQGWRWTSRGLERAQQESATDSPTTYLLTYQQVNEMSWRRDSYRWIARREYEQKGRVQAPWSACEWGSNFLQTRREREGARARRVQIPVAQKESQRQEREKRGYFPKMKG